MNTGKQYTLKTSSWHFRLYSLLMRIFSNGVTPNQISLCKYFWTTVALSLIVIFLCLGFVSVLFLMVPSVPVLLLSVFGVIDVDSHEYLQQWYILGILQIIAGFVFGVWYSSNKIISSYNVNQEKEDSLFVAYVKAKKSKLCPILEIEDKEEK